MRSLKRDDVLDVELLFEDITQTDRITPFERPRIIVVDDDRSMLELLSARLTTDGYRVDLAASAEDAMDLLGAEGPGHPAARAPFDLMLSDHRMRGFSGLSMLQEMRALGWRVPLVLMTAFPDRALQAASERMGVELIEKPFGLDQLSSTVTRLLLASAPVR